MTLSILGPESFRESMTDHLGDQPETTLIDGGPTVDIDHVADDHFGGRVDAHVVYCGSPHNWIVLAELASSVPTVAVIDTFELDSYVRALALGAGVVYAETPPATMTSVIAATINGEALVPLPIATVMARHEPPANAQMIRQPLTVTEEVIATALMEGQSNAQISASTNYSDRTVRRRLQGIYLKLGVSSRAAAIEELRARADAEE